MNYKELIISLLDKIDNKRFLKAIYISVRDYGKCYSVDGSSSFYSLRGNKE